MHAVAQAMSILREVGACNSNEATLTPLGHFLALLPIDVHLGKMLVYGALLGCLEPAVCSFRQFLLYFIATALIVIIVTDFLFSI